MKCGSTICATGVAIFLFGIVGSSRLEAGTVSNSFATDPGWAGFNNTTNGHLYGYRTTTVAGGAAGEAGGRFARSDKDSYYAHTNFGGIFTFDNPFTSSGKFDVTNITNMNGEVGIGYFSVTTNNPSFLGVVLMESDVNQYRVGAKIKNGTAGDSTGNLSYKYKDGNYWYFVNYTSTGGTYSLGQLTVIVTNATSGSATSTVSVTSADRSAGITLDSFGLVGLPRVSPTTNTTFDVLIDDVSYAVPDTGSVITNNFSSNPNWTATGNTTNGNNFGYSSSTSVAGGSTGEVGGTFARSSNENYFVSATFSPPLTLSNFFNATGKFDVNNNVNFDGEIGLGYFSTNKTDYSFVGLDVLESTNSSVFRVGGKITTGNNSETLGGLNIKSINGNYWYSINYTPTGGVSSLGRLTLIVTNATSGAVTSTVDVTSAMRTAGATLDAFGMGALPRPNGDSNLHIDVYMDDVIYVTTGGTGGGGAPPTGPFYITSLTSNSTYSGVINLAVSLGAVATNNVASVEYRLNSKNESMYYNGEQFLRPITTGPTYSTNWHTLNVPADSRVSLDAVARDASGNVLGTTPSIPVRFANSNTNFRVDWPLPGSTISGTSTQFSYSVDGGPAGALGKCKTSVDGKKVGISTMNNPPPATEKPSLDTTRWLNGVHELNFMYWPDISYSAPIGWIQFPVIFDNGHTAMELRLTWKELHLTPGETALQTATMYYTDATSSNPTAGSVTFNSSKPTVATINTSGLVTAISNGFATVTASYGGRVATNYVWVTSTHSFPHFTKSGQITTTWSTNSIFMREFFQCDNLTPGSAGSTNCGAQMRAGGINAFEAGNWWEDPGTNGQDVAWWNSGAVAIMQSLKNLAVSNNMSVYLIGDNMARTTDINHSVQATNKPLVQFAISNAVASGVVIGIDMVDEVNLLWDSNTPFPNDGRWMSSPPSNICNNSGITINSANLSTDGAIVHDYKANTAWAAANGSSSSNNYAIGKQITIDLGTTNEINGMRIWNDNQARSYSGVNGSISNYNLEVSINGTTWTMVKTNQILATAPRTNGYAGVYTAISPTWTNVRYARFTILGTYSKNNAETNVIGGLSEVMFSGRKQGDTGSFFILSNETASSSSLFWRRDSVYDTPDDTFAKLLNIFNEVPRPEITWSVQAHSDPGSDMKNWTGDPNASDYNGIYWEDEPANETVAAYPMGANIREVQSMTKYHTYDAWDAGGLQVDAPSFLFAVVTGCGYTKKTAYPSDYLVGVDTGWIPGWPPRTCTAQMLYALIIGMDGVRMWKFDDTATRNTRYTNTVNTGAGYAAAPPAHTPRGADRWAALSNAFNTIDVLLPYALQAQGHTRDYGQNFVSSVRTGANGRIVMVMNVSELPQQLAVDLSPYTTGANITRYRVLGEKTTTSSFASTSSDSVTFEPEETIFWTIPPQ